MFHKNVPPSKSNVLPVLTDPTSTPNSVGLSLVPARKQNDVKAPSSLLDLAIITSRRCSSFFAEAAVLVVHQDDATLSGMDSWNQSTHARTGLADKVKMSTLIEKDVEERMLAFLREHVPPKTSPMCGNTICQDRRFLARWMPELEDYFHYRNLDVSTLKELCKRWQPDVARGWTKQGKHEALADIYESIDELKYYRDTFIRP